MSIDVGGERRVSGLLIAPPRARACCVLAHGAGAGMAHPFLERVAMGLRERDIATLRFQFPYMEQGGKRPDPPALAQASVRAAVEEAGRALPGLVLIAGGKSFGGRMTSQAQAAAPLAGVRGLAFLGFPLHPAGKPSDQRARHLLEVRIPMLFLQGSRDSLAGPRVAAPPDREAGRTRHPAGARARRSLLPRARAQRAHGCGGPPGAPRCVRRVDRPHPLMRGLAGSGFAGLAAQVLAQRPVAEGLHAPAALLPGDSTPSIELEDRGHDLLRAEHQVERAREG